MKTFAFFTLLFSLFFLLIGCNIGSSNKEGAPIVCLGDSLTTGNGATTPGVEDKSKSYPAFLQAKVNVPVINAGVSGNTSAHGLARVDADVLSKKPQIVIISLGANDFFQGVPIATTQENLQSIISKLDNGKRKIYLAKFYTEAIARELAVTYGSAFGVTDPALQTAIINQYNALYSTLASGNNVTLIEDIWSGVWGIHMADVVHPNAKGYEIMADNIFAVMEQYLRANDLLK